jgi:hypothetical protein
MSSFLTLSNVLVNTLGVGLNLVFQYLNVQFWVWHSLQQKVSMYIKWFHLMLNKFISHSEWDIMGKQWIHWSSQWGWNCNQVYMISKKIICLNFKITKFFNVKFLLNNYMPIRYSHMQHVSLNLGFGAYPTFKYLKELT